MTAVGEDNASSVDEETMAAVGRCHAVGLDRSVARRDATIAQIGITQLRIRVLDLLILYIFYIGQNLRHIPSYLPLPVDYQVEHWL